MSNNDNCMYKSILVSGCTFRKWVLRRIMKWYQGEEVREVKVSAEWPVGYQALYPYRMGKRK